MSRNRVAFRQGNQSWKSGVERDKSYNSKQLKWTVRAGDGKQCKQSKLSPTTLNLNAQRRLLQEQPMLVHEYIDRSSACVSNTEVPPIIALELSDS